MGLDITLSHARGNNKLLSYKHHVPNTATDHSIERRLIRCSAVRIVFFHFESNRIVELLFEISNRIVIVGLKVTSNKYLLNKLNCFYGIALLWFLL